MYSYLENSLYHHGILGQKWGVRRYQNEDGTLTEAGRAKKEKQQAKQDAKKQKAIAKGDAKYISKHLDQFSDDELRSVYNRLDYSRKIDDIRTSKTKNRLTTYNMVTTSIKNTTGIAKDGIEIAEKVSGKHMDELVRTGHKTSSNSDEVSADPPSDWATPAYNDSYSNRSGSSNSSGTRYGSVDTYRTWSSKDIPSSGSARQASTIDDRKRR